MDRIRVLVFPCGSEIGLEIHRSLKYSRHIELIGGNSVDDHGEFVYTNYISGIPFYNDSSFAFHLKNLIKERAIDAFYPTMDAVIHLAKKIEIQLGCKVIAPSFETTEICLSKSRTYQLFKDKITVPIQYFDQSAVNVFPVFVKPDIGYGSRGVAKVNNRDALSVLIKENPNHIILEYLSGKEYTIDCFSNNKRQLNFCGARIRKRISNGISVRTEIADEIQEKSQLIAEVINSSLNITGAWFFQLKERENGELVLLEIACRLGGSSSLFRNKGINFALLSIFNAFDFPLEVRLNDFQLMLDRALYSRFKVNIFYDTVYVDLDDCLVMDDKVNANLVSFLYQCLNYKKALILLSRHKNNISNTLKRFRLNNLFDEIIHISDLSPKSNYILKKNAIFIDDSFRERKDVNMIKGIPVFAPDAIECLME